MMPGNGVIQMLPRRSPTIRTGKVTAVDANAHVFDALAAFTVTFFAGAGNAGDVQIIGADDDDGPPLAAGERLTIPDYICGLSQLRYQFANVGDVLYYVVTQ